LEDRSRELQARCNALSSTNEDLESKYQKSLKTNPDKDLKSTPKELKILQQKVSNLLDLNKEKTSINNTLKSAFDELESRYEVLLSAEEKQDTKDSDFIEIEDMKNNLNDLSDRLREEIAIKNTVIAALESLEEDSISNPQESLGIPPEAESLEFLRDRNRELQAVLNTLQSAYQDLEEKYQKLGS
jgi:chromosome segregation ATPase